jgi:hypothetical protein
MNFIAKELLKIEEKARKYFEQFPFVQAFLAGIGVIIFWRGIWEGLDESGVSPIASIILGVLILGAVGVFVQTFIGNTIIIKEVKQEEKDKSRILKEVAKEESTESASLAEISIKLDQIMKKMEDHK